MLKKIFCLILTFAVCSLAETAYSQTPADKVTVDSYAPDFLGELISGEVNKYRAANNVDTLEINDVLLSAAGDQAIYMAEKGEVNAEQSKAAKKTTGKRVRYYGGSSEGSEEIVIYTTPGKGKEQFTYEKVAKDALEKIVKNKKLGAILLKKDYTYIGSAAAMDGTGKKIYVSIVVGNEAAITSGK